MNFSVLFILTMSSIGALSQASTPTPTPIPADFPIVPLDNASGTLVPINTSSHELMAELPKQLSHQVRPTYCGQTFTSTRSPSCTFQRTVGTIFHGGRFGSTWITFQQIPRGLFRVTIRAFGSGVYINTVGVALTMDSRAPSFRPAIFSRTRGVTGVVAHANSRWIRVRPGSSTCCFSQIYVHMSINQCYRASCSPRRRSFSTTVQCGSPC